MDRVRERPRLVKEFKLPSRTLQASKDECDVNKILAKYKKTGVISHLNKYEGKYDDVSDTVDYQTALNIVRESDEVFKSLPADVRSRFANNPAEFFEFVHDPKNIDEMVSMGLARAPAPPPEPVQVRVVDSSATPLPEVKS